MTTQPATPEYYTDDAGEVRWRVRDANGEITEAATEGFANLRKAWDNYTLTRSNVQITYQEAQAQVDDSTDARRDEGTDASPSEGTGGLIADSAGSAGESEEANRGGNEEGAGGSEAGVRGEDDPDSRA